MIRFEIQRHESVRDRLNVGVLLLAPLAPPDPEVCRVALEDRDRALTDLRSRWSGRTPGEIPACAASRSLYRTFGIDPTRHRPSSEALLRRVLKDKPFPEVNPVVDWGNLVAVIHQRSLGLYDLDKLQGVCTVRSGEEAEGYEGIRKGRVNLEGKPLLADELGPFGNPTSDSLRTSVGPEVRTVAMIVFAPVKESPGALDAVLEDAAERAVRTLGWAASAQVAHICLGDEDSVCLSLSYSQTSPMPSQSEST